MEALRNLGGVAFVRGYHKYDEFNVRKFQARFVDQSDEAVDGKKLGATQEKKGSGGGDDAVEADIDEKSEEGGGESGDDDEED